PLPLLPNQGLASVLPSGEKKNAGDPPVLNGSVLTRRRSFPEIVSHSTISSPFSPTVTYVPPSGDRCPLMYLWTGPPPMLPGSRSRAFSLPVPASHRWPNPSAP